METLSYRFFFIFVLDFENILFLRLDSEIK